MEPAVAALVASLGLGVPVFVALIAFYGGRLREERNALPHLPEDLGNAPLDWPTLWRV